MKKRSKQVAFEDICYSPTQIKALIAVNLFLVVIMMAGLCGGASWQCQNGRFDYSPTSSTENDKINLDLR